MRFGSLVIWAAQLSLAKALGECVCGWAHKHMHMFVRTRVWCVLMPETEKVAEARQWGRSWKQAPQEHCPWEGHGWQGAILNTLTLPSRVLSSCRLQLAPAAHFSAAPACPVIMAGCPRFISHTEGVRSPMASPSEIHINLIISMGKKR